MIAKAHPIDLQDRKMDMEDIDSYFRSQGLTTYYGISTYPDGTVAVVVTNDHTDPEYDRMQSRWKDKKDDWDTKFKKDGSPLDK